MTEAALDITADADDQKLLAQVVAYYCAALKNAPAALEFLQARSLTSGDAIDQFRIGYCDRSLGLKLPAIQFKAGRQIRSRLQALGVLRSSGHEHFRGSITLPVLAGDGTGQIVDIYGCKTRSNLRKGTVLEVFLKPARQGVWNVAALASTDEIILCASPWDALTFWSHGYRNVTCTFGADALTEDHLAAFQEFKTRRVLVAAESLAPRLLAVGLDCFRLALPFGVPAHAYVAQADTPAEALGAVIRKAEWLGKGQAVSMPTTAVAPAPPNPVPPVPSNEAAPLPTTTAPPAGPSPTPSCRSASPLPPVPSDIDVQVKEDEALLTFGDRRYRVRGWAKNLAFDQLRVNVLVANDAGMFVDTFDLYSAKQRHAFVSQAAQELVVQEQTVKKDLGRVLLILEELQDRNIADTLAPKDASPQMTEDERSAALGLLRDPQLLDRIVEDFHIVGERTNKLIGYLAAISRKLDQPLAVIIQSSSAAGKTALMDAVLSFVPPEEQVKYSAMTGQSLFYMGETNLKHKILAIVEEEGAERASYALKLLQSEGELRIASTGKDANSGRLVTQEYRVEGPVMIFLTTTAIKIDEELLNRCLVLTVDEDREQTRAIHQRQRQQQTLLGQLSARTQREPLSLHRNAQRLLRPVLVANPYAEALTFADDKTRTRRDHAKYLTLIRAVALLHQYQRPVRTVEHQGKPVEYIEVTLEDIDVANTLAHEVLGRALDELPPQTRRLLNKIAAFVAANCQQRGIDRADYRFSRRDVREHTGWGHSQLQVHLKRLEALEYLLVHRGARGRSFVYELLYQPPADQSQRLMPGLIDVLQLRRNLPGSASQFPGRIRPHSGVNPGSIRPCEFDATADDVSANDPSATREAENAHADKKLDPVVPYLEVNHVPRG